MTHGSLPRWLDRSLPAGEFTREYAPDGLDEQAVDVLIAEVCERGAQPVRPSWSSVDQTTQRRVRRLVRQVVRRLAAGEMPVHSTDESEAA